MGAHCISNDRPLNCSWFCPWVSLVLSLLLYCLSLLFFLLLSLSLWCCLSGLSIGLCMMPALFFICSANHLTCFPWDCLVFYCFGYCFGLFLIVLYMALIPFPLCCLRSFDRDGALAETMKAKPNP